ncbi:MAG: Asp-tRNA(Asn)/Glu-tRNA(Gln) amidotransferase subunit GatC [Caldilineaceae bacterium]|nr:Asp-tRNA(Asn)/Glu-tRNA(Gln) amidotransferase subunit GatC [Caldilineaceae bacterium]
MDYTHGVFLWTKPTSLFRREVNVKLTREEVRHVAELAKLQLSDAELDEYSGQLGQILTYAQQVQSVDTSAVPPTPQVLPLSNVLADDESLESLSNSQAVRNAPDSDDGYFRVIAVFDDVGA